MKGKFQMNEDKRSKRVKGLVLFSLFIVFFLLVAYIAGEPLVRFINDPEKFRAWVDEKGIAAHFVFVLMVLFQVIIAIVPGEPFEIAAGYAFGYVEGTVLFMIGSLIGSAVIFLFVRRYGQRLCNVFFDREKLDKLKFLKDTRKNRVLFFIIFTIPGTPKDLLSYFAGLSDMSFGWWMFVASVGRIPSLITSVIGGGALGNGEYVAAAVVFGIALIISAAGYLVYKGIMKRHSGEKEE